MGDYFFMLKFRSMFNNAEEQEEEVYRRSRGVKTFNDPRVTKIGRVIRKLSLDELPQFVNVIKGEMSLVGPRPISLEMFNGLPNQEKRIYLSLLPGITGPGQISVRSLLGLPEFEYERLYSEYRKSYFDYFQNCSLWLDCKILLKTIPLIISCRGAY